MHALILAGGKGERLRPLTDTLPKPMVPVCGKPILQRQVEWLKEGSVDGVVFLAGYLWETIRDYFGDGSGFGISAEYSIEDSPLGRGGAIKQGYPLAPPSGEPVVVTNGDIITRQPLAEILEFHRNSPARENGPSVTLLSVPMVSPYGIVDMDGDGRVVGFREKVELPHWINGGVYVFDREVFSEFPRPRRPRSGDLSASGPGREDSRVSDALLLDEHRFLQGPAGSRAVSFEGRGGAIVITSA